MLTFLLIKIYSDMAVDKGDATIPISSSSIGQGSFELSLIPQVIGPSVTLFF